MCEKDFRGVVIKGDMMKAIQIVLAKAFELPDECIITFDEPLGRFELDLFKNSFEKLFPKKSAMIMNGSIKITKVI
jgi:hypothetical protein